MFVGARVCARVVVAGVVSALSVVVVLVGARVFVGVHECTLDVTVGVVSALSDVYVVVSALSVSKTKLQGQNV